METNKAALNSRRAGLTSWLRTGVTSRVGLAVLLAILIVTLGTLFGYAVARLHFLVPTMLMAVTLLILLLMRRPFDAVIVWLLVAPFFVITEDVTTRYVYWLTHRTIIPLALIIALVNASVRKRLRFDLVDFFLLAYLLIVAFSVLYYFPDGPILELYRVYDWCFVGIALFWLIRITRPGEVELRRMMVALILVSLAQGIVGLMMNFIATQPTLPEAWIRLSNERTTGSLGRVAEYSSTLTASMLLVAHFAFHARRRLVRLLCVIALFLGSICLVLSFSRGTWLAAATVAVLAIVMYRRLAPYVVTLAAILVLILSTNAFEKHMDFAAERLDNQVNIDARIVTNYAQVRMIQVKPLLGWGWDSYDRYHSAFLRPVGEVAVPDSTIASHNTYLSMAVELGLLGLAAFLLPALLLLKRSLPAYRRLPGDGFYSRYLLIVLWLGVVFWFVVTNFMNMRLAPWGMTWLGFLLGLIASVVDTSKEPPGKTLDVQFTG